MGCSNTRPAGGNGTMVVSMDTQVPFTLTQIEEIRSVWNLVKRKFEDTAMENMLRFFRINPIFQEMFHHLGDSLMSEQDMRQCQVFQTHAMAVFSIYDDVIENLTRDGETIQTRLEEVASIHSGVDGFHGQFFKYMEDPLIESLRDKLWGDFHDSDEELFRKLFQWMQIIMTSECEAIQYNLVPGK